MKLAAKAEANASVSALVKAGISPAWAEIFEQNSASVIFDTGSPSKCMLCGDEADSTTCSNELHNTLGSLAKVIKLSEGAQPLLTVT